MHVHDAWTLLIVDDGAVRYDLDRHKRGTPNDTVSLLPPQVPHNGSPATSHGFRKRVLYLSTTQLDESYIGPAVDGPDLTDPVLRRRIGQLHTALARRGDELEAESRLALISQRLREHLRPRTALVGVTFRSVASRTTCVTSSTRDSSKAPRWKRPRGRSTRTPPISYVPSAPRSASHRTST
jgi:hypothetical protein